MLVVAAAAFVLLLVSLFVLCLFVCLFVVRLLCFVGVCLSLCTYVCVFTHFAVDCLFVFVWLFVLGMSVLITFRLTCHSLADSTTTLA